jgi:hypothetical protein
VTYAVSSARITGSIDSYISRASTQSLTRLASSSCTTPLPNLRIFGLSAGLSSKDMTSWMYSVCASLCFVIRCRREETTIATAKANSCALNSRITELPAYGNICAQIRLGFNHENMVKNLEWLTGVICKRVETIGHLLSLLPDDLCSRNGVLA